MKNIAIICKDSEIFKQYILANYPKISTLTARTAYGEDAIYHCITDKSDFENFKFDDWHSAYYLNGMDEVVKCVLDSIVRKIPESAMDYYTYVYNTTLTKKYQQLDTAVKDLLMELRISPKELKIMAEGYSPEYRTGKFSNCKVQLSKVVANKLLNTLDL